MQEINVEDSPNLAELLHLRGPLSNRALCAGLGKCGLCRVRYLDAAPAPKAADISRLAPREIEQGWRLACQREAENSLVLQLPAGAQLAPPPFDLSGLDPAQPARVALDIGTTNLHWSIFQSEAQQAAGAEPNPQMGLGAEVMSRMAAALAGRGPLLSRLVLDRLAELLDASPAPTRALGVAGNPAMVHLLLGLDPSSIAAAPYALNYAGGETRQLRPDLPPAYLPPLLGPFVGSDAACAALAVVHDPAPKKPPFLLADLGTNGELILALGENRFLAASAPMGPALEGAGLSCGRVAGDGVAVRFELSPAGLRMFGPDGAPLQDPAGVSGVGYLSLTARLRQAGLVDAWGRFAAPDSPLGKRLARSLVPPGDGPARDLPLRREPMLDLGGGLFLPASDLEEIVKVKAAFNAAVSALLQAAGLRAAKLSRIFLAGALGVHAQPADLEALGFLPPGAAGLASPVGDAALRGLELTLDDPAARAWIEALPGRTRVLDLPADPRFQEAFAKRLSLDYT